MTTVEHDAGERAAPTQDGGPGVTPRPPVDYWLKLVDALINQRFAELLDEHGVTRREWEMLRLLTAGPATREVLDEALLPFLGPAPGTSTADQLAELVDSGWVARDEAGYILTSVGRQSFTRLDAAVQRVDSAITAGLAPEELATAVAVLQQMARNLGRSGALRPGAPTD